MPWIVRLAVCVLLISIAGGDVQAHGGGAARLVDAPAGPYRLYVWTRPDPIRVGTAHFTVGVFERAPGTELDEPVLDASVELALVPTAGGGGWAGRASREDSINKLYYEADVAISAEGEWEATLDVDGPRGTGRAEFGFAAMRPGVNWFLIGGAAAAAVVAGWWLLGTRQREQNE